MHDHLQSNPTTVEAEENVLACLLSNPRNVARVIGTLKAEHFIDAAHADIYRMIEQISHHGQNATPYRVKQELKRLARWDTIAREYGEDYLDMLALNMVAFQPIEQFADTIRKTYRFQRTYALAAELARAAREQDEHGIERVTEELANLETEQDTKPVAHLADVLDRYMDTLSERRDNFKRGVVSGVPTGFSALDELLGGLQPSRLNILAARPSDGKTALALNVALNIVQHARHALFFSLEMDEDELAQRLMAMESPIDQSLLRDGDIADKEFAHLKDIKEQLAPCKMDIDDRTYTLADISSKARRVHRQQPLDVIVVDYLQMIDVPPELRKQGRPRTEQVAELSRGLKRLARELKVPILALAQLNREADKADVPQLSHLGESSSIEKDADVIMFLHCEPLERERRERNEAYDIHVLIRKHRNGARGRAILRFQPRTTKFQDVPEGYNEPISL